MSLEQETLNIMVVKINGGLQYTGNEAMYAHWVRKSQETRPLIGTMIILLQKLLSYIVREYTPSHTMGCARA